MPVVRPMRALHYGRDHLHLLDELVSPAVRGEPEDRTRVGDVHPLCVRQLIRGERGALADPQAPLFTHAARLLRRWKEQGVLVRDPRPSLYVHEQGVGDVARRGLVGLVRLGPPDGPVRAHELVSGTSTDRLQAQLATTGAQLSLVMAIVPDDTGQLADWLARPRGRPMLQVEDGLGTASRVWRDEAPASQLDLLAGLSAEPAVIADGHHRYAAALRHQQAAGASRRERPLDYVMMLLVPASDPGLRCEPTHRAWPSLTDGAGEELEALGDRFDVLELASEQALIDFLDDDDGVRFGLVRPGRRHGLVLRDPGGAPDHLPGPLRAVDAAVANALIAGRLPAAAASGASGTAWTHNQTSGRQVATRAFEGDLELALLLRPVPARQVLEVALAGELMPPKSTNFVPKPTKGLLIGSLASF